MKPTKAELLKHLKKMFYHAHGDSMGAGKRCTYPQCQAAYKAIIASKKK